MSPRPILAAAAAALVLSGCSGGAHQRAAQPPPARAPQPSAAGVAAAHPCVLAPLPIDRQHLPGLSAYDAQRRLAHTQARLAGEAAARAPARWNALAAAWSDLAEVYETARQEYSAVLAGSATAAERRNVAQLQAVALTAVTTIRKACARPG